MKSHISRIFSVLIFFMLLGCQDKTEIVSNIDEREANLIVVFLESKGISATKKVMAVQAGESGGIAKFNIVASREKAIEAMTLLNQNGLPKRVGPSLLELFAPSGLMNSDKQETIRYQAGLAQQIQNTLMMIDGVIDVSVQISFPAAETTAEAPNRITAAVFVKHQGIVDDPNSHLESKIKRLVAGSVNGLEISDVTVVSDRSRLNDITMSPEQGRYAQDFAQIWSITMTKRSLGVFRFIFGFLLTFIVLLLVALGWILYKAYPLIRENGGFKEFFIPIPMIGRKKEQPNQ